MKQKPKERIIAAAETLIFQNGCAQTTIAGIARRAGVADSLVYRHFRNKEDLLFSLARAGMQGVLDQLNGHLADLDDPQAQLRKMIWFSLQFNDRNRGYARTLLFECRSNQAFYASPAYRLVRRYAGRLMEILARGAEGGTFRTDRDLRIVRDIILGLLDFAAIRCLTERDHTACADRLDSIMALVMPMVQAGQHSPKQTKADRILAAAERVIAAKGFAAAQIAEIARLAGVADGTIYEYFRSKEDLLMAIPEKYFAREMDNLTEDFSTADPIHKLRRLVRRHFMLHLVNRRFLKVFLLSIQLNTRFYDSAAWHSYARYLTLMEQVVAEGKSTGHFRSDVEPDDLKDLLLGALSNMTLRWLIVEKERETDKMREIEQAVDLIADAVVARG